MEFAGVTTRVLPCKVPSRGESGGETTSRGPTSLAEIRHDVLLSLTEDYAVLSKPADVRMDGDFSVTVEKLLLSWRLPSIQSVQSIKWVHQLDYATSGCLCVALNRKAAAAASLAFEQREVKKEYLALIYGHLDLDRWPLSEGAPEHIDYSVGKSLTNKHAPPKTHPTWQDNARDAAFDAVWAALLKELQCAQAQMVEAADPSLISLRELAQRPREEFLRDARLRKALRKALRARGLCPDVPECGTGAGDGERPTKSARASSPPPPIASAPFCVASSSASDIGRYADTDAAGGYFLRIRVPVAEVPGEFRMEVGHEGRPGKACETDLRVLERGLYLGDAVTKVLLTPLTGRRHQLRVHCLAIGHPIVGDCTYADGDRAGDAARMMLHAHRLEVPEVSKGRRRQDPPRFLVQTSAPDPFPSLV